MTTAPAHRGLLVHRALILAGILLDALNLRSPIVAVAPVLDRIVHDVGLTAVTAGLLTTLPVLAFAAGTALAAGLIGRIGADFAVGVSLIGVILGVAIRSLGTAAPLFAGTVVMGFAITLGNVVVPVLIRRNYAADQRAAVTGLYSAALNVGSMLTLVATVPLSDAIGWQLALFSWSGLTVGALIVWGIAIGWRRLTRPTRMPRAAVDTNTAGITLPALTREAARGRRLRIAALAIGFGAQAFSYYGFTAWLPQVLGEVSALPASAASAGSSLFQVCAIVGALGVPVLTKRLPYWAIFLLVVALWAAVPLGLLLAPSLWFIWLGCGGVAQGGTFTMVFIVVVQLARTDGEAGKYSALVQGVGYTIGASGPSFIGALNDATGGWRVPVAGILAAIAVLAAGSLYASRGMGVGPPRRPNSPRR